MKQETSGNDPGKPTNSAEAIRHLEQWALAQLHDAYQDPDEMIRVNARSQLAHLQGTLSFLYANWEFDEGAWDGKIPLKAPPPEEWLSRSDYLESLQVIASNFDFSLEEIWKEFQDIRQVLELHPARAGLSQEILDTTLLMQSVLQFLCLGNNQLYEWVRDRVRENGPTEAAAEKPGLTRRSAVEPRTDPERTERKRTRGKRGGKGSRNYVPRAVEWAQEHDGMMNTRELSNHLHQTDMPDMEPTAIQVNLTTSIRRSGLFERTGQGNYRLLGETE